MLFVHILGGSEIWVSVGPGALGLEGRAAWPCSGRLGLMGGSSTSESFGMPRRWVWLYGTLGTTSLRYLHTYLILCVLKVPSINLYRCLPRYLD